MMREKVIAEWMLNELQKTGNEQAGGKINFKIPYFVVVFCTTLCYTDIRQSDKAKEQITMIQFQRSFDSQSGVHTISFDHGYIDLFQVSDDEEDSNYCFRISHVHVEESHRGKGYGVALYVEAARLAKELGLLGVGFDDEATEEAQRVWSSLRKHQEISFNTEANYAGIGGYCLK